MNFRRNLSDYFINSMTTTSFMLGVGTALLANRYAPEIKDEILSSNTASQAQEISQRGQQLVANRIQNLEEQLDSLEHKISNNLN